MLGNLQLKKAISVEWRVMDIRFALKRQYHAALAQLRECAEKASEEVWLAGVHPRNFWRIAYHAAFYTHLYLGQTEADFEPWEHHRDGIKELWPEANAPVAQPYSKVEILSYISQVDGMIDAVVDQLDLEADTGFYWYKEMGKLEHQILNIRHIQSHVGQLSELLMADGVDGEFWISKG